MLFNCALTKDNIIDWEDALPTSPAMDYCKEIADELIKLLPDGFDDDEDVSSLSTDTIEKIRGLFATLEGYETYQR